MLTCIAISKTQLLWQQLGFKSSSANPTATLHGVHGMHGTFACVDVGDAITCKNATLGHPCGWVRLSISKQHHVQYSAFAND